MLTAIWQAPNFRERDWIEELFGAHINNHVWDGKQRVIMDNCILVDQFIHRKPAAYYEQFRAKNNVYLLHLSDEQYHGGYEVYKNFTGVFRNYWSTVFNPESVFILPLGYSNGIKERQETKRTSERKYVWSFAGDTERGSRPEMLSALESIRPHFSRSTDRSQSAPLTPEEYQHVLEDTIFAPCPMGRINLECFRLYEALECGAIPIVERRFGLDYFSSLLGRHPFLTVRKWSELKDILVLFVNDPHRLAEKQSEVGSWWKAHKASIKRNINNFFETRSDGRHATETPIRWSYHLPLWQPLELCRHHSAAALLRRFEVQARRLISAA
jgi:hypothetical protein